MIQTSVEWYSQVAQLAERRRALIERLWTQPTGVEWCVAHTEIADSAIRKVVAEVQRQHPDMPAFAVVATGGYGRSELAPYSDVDLAVVPLDEAHAAFDAGVRTMYRLFVEAFHVLGIEVGYTYRLIADLPGLEPKSRTGLLDARLVAGSHETFETLMDAFWDSLPVGEFVLEKIDERRRAFEKYHDTPLVTEPHLKEGAGGLRCWHCSNWLDMAVGGRPTRPNRAFERVVRERNLLHAAAGKPLELLSRQRQAEIADRLGRDPYDAMRELALAMEDLHREYQAAIERLHETRFPLAEGVLASRGEVRFFGQTRLSRAAVGIALASRLGLRVLSLEAPPMEGIEGPEALFALTNGEEILRKLDRCGILHRMLPELTRCRALMPPDALHVYSVFEHTLRAIRLLDSLSPGTFLGDIYQGLQDRSPLYLATLLHDVGKIDPQAEHEVLGAEMAADIGARFGLRESITDEVVWLVRHHLEMARIMRMRDVMNPFTARELAELVGSNERLDALTLLTWADLSAVSPEAFTPVLDAFLRELYTRTSQLLQEESPVAPTPDPILRRLARDLKRQEIPEEEIRAFLDSLPPDYVMSTPAETVRLHLGLVRKARSGDSTIEISPDSSMGGSELTICTPDFRGLLGAILGVVYAYNLRVHAIRACTTRSEPPIAIDTFHISFGDRPVPDATSRQVVKALTEVLGGMTTVEEVMRRFGKDPDRPQRWFSYRFVEGEPAILEIQAPRGRGMAFRFSRMIAQQGWNIAAARVSQWGGRGTAAFYLYGSDGAALSRSEVEAAFPSADG